MIPFIDLKSQQALIRDQLDARFTSILDHCGFVGGPEVEELESELSAYCGSKHTLGCSNGTDALILALMLKGVGPGDAVIVPAWTFVATAEAVAILGATPVFVDSYEDTFNLDPESVRMALYETHSADMKVKGIISVGIFGQPADMDAIHGVAKEHGLWVIDDAAQSFGALYNGQRAGNLADVSITSFFPAKPLGCYGDGGAVFTNSDEDIEILRSMRVHGQGSNKYENIRLGMTGRLPTFQAGVLLEKMKIFPGEFEARQGIAARYSEGLEDVARPPHVLDNCMSSWAIYTVKVQPEIRAALIEDLKAAGIPSGVYYSIPLHLQKAYKHFPRAEESLRISEQLSKEVLSLPMHPYLTEEQQGLIINKFRESVERHGKTAA